MHMKGCAVHLQGAAEETRMAGKTSKALVGDGETGSEMFSGKITIKKEERLFLQCVQTCPQFWELFFFGDVCLRNRCS